MWQYKILRIAAQKINLPYTILVGNVHRLHTVIVKMYIVPLKFSIQESK